MPEKAKRRYTARDRLAAYLVILVVIGLLFAGAILLYMTGIFEPVQGEVSLQGTKTLEEIFPTPSPSSTAKSSASTGLFALLVSSASAEEEAPLEEEADFETEMDLEAFFAEIVAEERGESEITEEDRVTINKKDLSVNDGLPEEWYNVLLLATDSRNMRLEPGRTDVMIIASIHAKTGQIKLTSLARDMYVHIPGTQNSNRINTAFNYGMANLAMKTVNETFAMNIEEYVLVNFHVMADIVDSLGGVDIQLHGTEYLMINMLVDVAEDYEGFDKTPSRRRLTEQDADTIVHLDGLQAVCYARIRKSDSDIQRGSRQRILLQALFEKVMDNATLPTLISLFNSVSRTAETNIAVSKMMEVASMILLTEPTIEEFALPVQNGFKNSVEKDSKGKEMQVMTINADKNAQALHEYIYGEYFPIQDK